MRQKSKLSFFDEPLIVLAMQVVVSLVVLTAGLYVILAQSYALDDKKWGYGIVGTVIGYWFKGRPVSHTPSIGVINLLNGSSADRRDEKS